MLVFSIPKDINLHFLYFILNHILLSIFIVLKSQKWIFWNFTYRIFYLFSDIISVVLV